MEKNVYPDTGRYYECINGSSGGAHTGGCTDRNAEAARSNAGEVTEILPCEDVYTVNGVKPVLPDKVKVKIGEEEGERDVVWNLAGKSFSGDSGIVTVEGTVAGSDQKASIDVHMAMENAVYVIECNSPNSSKFREVAAYANLRNETGDQKYREGNQWGYLGDYLSHDPNSSDNYASGWYADKTKPSEEQVMKYQLPLDAGAYKVTFGASEWWDQWNDDKHRYMDAAVVHEDGTEQALGKFNAYNGGDWWSTTQFSGISCEDAEDLIFEIRKGEDGREPVISFLWVQKDLNLNQLKDALQKFSQLDKDRYADKQEAFAAVYQAALEGHPLLYLSSATQEAVDAAAAAIEAALEALGSAETVLSKEALEANHYVLYTANCGTPDPSVIPNTNSERLGLLQSSVDQKLGKDVMTGYRWGCDPDTQYSIVAKSAENATDIGRSFIYMSTESEFDKNKSALWYSFEVPMIEAEGIEPNTYEVTVAFEHHWSGSDKTMNILLEGRTVATDVFAGDGDWVSKKFMVEVTDGELNVQVKAPRRTNTNGDPILNFIRVRAVKHTEPEITAYDYISGNAGETLYDTEGRRIQAHGGQVQKIGDTWYWIGEDKTNDYRPCGGIHMYSSKDLCNWDDEGVVLKTMESEDEFETDGYFKNLYGDLTDEEKTEIFIDLDRNNCVMERPKMLYNNKTGKYVIWFHADGRTPTNSADYGKAKAGVAVADSPAGPFQLLGSYKLNYHKASDGGPDGDYSYGYDGWDGRGSVRDMNLFQDDDGTAYVIYSSDGNQTTYISRLNEAYIGLAADRDAAVEGEDFIRAFGWSREAPAMFKYNGKYYIINSGCTGWAPNAAECWMSDSPLGTWRKMGRNGGNPCIDSGSDTTYTTQSTCVIPVDPDNGFYIYMGDRWNSGNLRDSRYVWLPMEFDGNDEPAIRSIADWNPQEKNLEAANKIFNSVFQEAEALKKTDYTKETWSVLQEAFDTAKAVQEKENASVQEITDARKALQTGMEGLQEAPKAAEEDWAKLEAAIRSAETKQESDYTDKSWSPFAKALAAAKELLEQKDAELSKEAVDEAASVLSEAQEGLKAAGREALEAAAEEARAKEEEVYTASSFTRLKKALEKADAALADAGSSKADIKAALDALETALDKLIRKHIPEKTPVTQFMDCIEPMYITNELSSACWGAADVGARDPENGLEDQNMEHYCYWDGGIIKDEETGKYYMFASRWNQAGGHWGENGILGWQGSQAIYAVSDSLYGPYADQGPIWPDWCEGAGHNVFPFKLSTGDPLYKEGYRYAISISDTGMHGETANGTIHISKSLQGPWELIDNGNSGKLKASGGEGFSLSNISIMVRPDGKYEATNRNGDIAIADSVAGTWDVKVNGLWWKIDNMNPEQVEDPVIWYSDGLYHIVVNKWDARMAYYMTSEDGINNWTRRPGTAYTPIADFLRYEDGTINNWAKIERPNIYVEDGKIAAMTFAVIDVQKESDHGNDQHGSKVIVVPFSSEKLTELDAQPSPMESRTGILSTADAAAQSYGSEDGKNYGAEEFLQIQKSPDYLSRRMGRFGEGRNKPYNEYDNKIGYIKYDLSEYQMAEDEEIENAYLSLVYLEKVTDDAESTKIEAVLCDADWEEGSGKESVNGNAAAAHALTWNNRPKLNYSEEDAEGTIAQSELFYTADLKRVVNIDVTNLVRKFYSENPQSTELAFAIIATSTGSRMRVGSKEAGEEYAPMLVLNVKGDGTADKTALNAAIAEAETLNADDYTAESWEEFQKWLHAAKSVSEHKYAAQSAVNRALKNLNDAKKELVKTDTPITPGPDKADKTALDAAIRAAEALQEDDYTAESWAVFAEKLNTANDVSQNKEADQAAVDEALDNLNKAKDTLVKKDTPVTSNPDNVDKAALEAAIQEAEALQVEDYTAESWAAFQEALKAAKAAAENKEADQAAVDKALNSLTEAREALQAASQKPPVTDVSVKVNKIVIKGSSNRLYQGESTQLQADIAPANASDKTVIWASSNSKIASVTAEGLVTGTGTGTAEITASAADGSGVKGTYTITVLEREAAGAVKKITLKSNTKGIAAGKKVTIEAKVTATGNAVKTLAWSSSNKKYATVNSKGVVTTKKAGAGKTVTITAKAKDGSGVTAKIKVKIMKDSVKKISLKCSKKSVAAGKKVTVKASVKTSGKKKTVTITAAATDGTKKKASIKIRIK